MHQIALIIFKNVLMNHINENSFQSICLKCPPPICTCDHRLLCHWSFTASITSCL